MKRQVRQARTAVALLGVALFASQSLSLGAAPRSNVKQLMTAQEFKSTGLTKLTPDELVALDAWLDRYAVVVLTVAKEQAGSGGASTAPPDAIETCIDGEFKGWEGETIFKLCNGQIWQQAEYSYTYTYAYRPDVVIYKTSAGYRMKVEDEEEAILVRRIR